MHVLYAQAKDDRQALVQMLREERDSLWFGALSFEDRCVGSLNVLRDSGLFIQRAIALEYPTSVYPIQEDHERRESNRAIIQGLTGTVFSEDVLFETVNPYALQNLQEVFETNILNRHPKLVVFDISCLTKIHTLAIASYLARATRAFKWIVAYSIPENYGNLDSTTRAIGWKDVIIAPLAETAHLFYETHSRGVIVAGHEADRLLVALTEVEPSGGVILLGDTPQRPDLKRLCVRLNQKIFRHLSKMRSREWRQSTSSILDFNSISAEIRKEVGLAREKNAPVILFPYGPKSVIFEIGFTLVREYPESSWFVYPVPAAYDVSYSEGISSTYWFVQ